MPPFLNPRCNMPPMGKIADFVELDHKNWQAAGSAQIFIRLPFPCE
jgi:hypothetical protein